MYLIRLKINHNKIFYILKRAKILVKRYILNNTLKLDTLINKKIMGTDIHFYVEIKKKNKDATTKWVYAPLFYKSEETFKESLLYPGRNSIFFQYLQDNCNNGLPEDISEEIDLKIQKGIIKNGTSSYQIYYGFCNSTTNELTKLCELIDMSIQIKNLEIENLKLKHQDPDEISWKLEEISDLQNNYLSLQKILTIIDIIGFNYSIYDDNNVRAIFWFDN